MQWFKEKESDTDREAKEDDGRILVSRMKCYYENIISVRRNSEEDSSPVTFGKLSNDWMPGRESELENQGTMHS